eukprot:1351915-Prymnesium_polylepis.2
MLIAMLCINDLHDTLAYLLAYVQIEPVVVLFSEFLKGPVSPVWTSLLKGRRQKPLSASSASSAASWTRDERDDDDTVREDLRRPPTSQRIAACSLCSCHPPLSCVSRCLTRARKGSVSAQLRRRSHIARMIALTKELAVDKSGSIVAAVALPATMSSETSTR